MRLYSFTNMYTSGIHAGIQTAHVIHEMMRKYDKRISSGKATAADLAKLMNLNDWADNHKTIIVKNGGYHSALIDLYKELTEYSAFFEVPIERWREGRDALNGAQTAVAIVVPKMVYNFEDPNNGVSTWPRQAYTDSRVEMAYQFNQVINRYRFAT